MDFVAIDFETANEMRCSPCAFAVAVVSNGKLTAQHSWLIRPKELRFDPYNVWIHGITEDDVAEQPEFNELWDTFRPFLEGAQVVVAHNASFDMSVLRHTLSDYGIPFPAFDYSCTRIIAKKSWPGLLSYGLKPIAEMLGIEFEHHQVEQDAVACATVALHAGEKFGANSFQALNDHLDIRNGKLLVDGYRPVQSSRSSGGGGRIIISELVPTTNTFDTEHPFYDRMFAFTGKLQSMTREEAMQKVIDIGGRCNNGVTAETNFLVLGDQDFRKLSPNETKSSKMKKAETIIAKGADLEVISENEFLRSLGR